MRKYILFTGVTFLLLSCGTTQNYTDKVEEINSLVSVDSFKETQKKGVDFYALGTDPFWSLEIDFDKNVRFRCSEKEDPIVIPIMKLGQEDELPIVTYEVKGDGADLIIHIQKNEQTFNLSEGKRPYKVDVEYRKKGESEYSKHMGGGEYYGDIRLHDQWKLDEINGKNISEFTFKNHPFIQIHLNDYRVSGHLGCNNFSGAVYFGREQIFFQHLLSTKMACLDADIESLFAKTISNKMFYYKIEGGKLTLENDSDKLIFIQ